MAQGIWLFAVLYEVQQRKKVWTCHPQGDGGEGETERHKNYSNESTVGEASQPYAGLSTPLPKFSLARSW